MKVFELEGAQLDYWVARAEGWEFFWSKHDYWNVKAPDADSYASACKEWTRFDSGTGRSNQRPAPWEALLEFGYSPSADWAQAGAIIEREQIALIPGADWRAGYEPVAEVEGAGYDTGPMATIDLLHEHCAATPLVAAMRAYVASKFGDEVPEKIDNRQTQQ